MFGRVASRGLVLRASRLSSRMVVAAAGLVTIAAATQFQRQAYALSAPNTPARQAIAPEGIPGTSSERTFIAIKPDGVNRHLIGQIIQRFEQKGYTLVAMKLLQPTQAQAEGHYDDLKSKPFFPKLTKFFSSGPIVAMVWQGRGAILTGRKMLGETDPLKSNPGSIRGDFCVELGRNIIHGSDGPESAKHEISFWFKPEELVNWQPGDTNWIYE